MNKHLLSNYQVGSHWFHGQNFSWDSKRIPQILVACYCLKKNQSTSRPSEHPPVMGEKMSKRLGGIKGCCCCCLHIKSRSDLYSVLSNIHTCPTDANAFRGHRLTTQKGYTYRKEIKGPRKVNTHSISRKENNPPQKNKAPDSQTSQATRQRR